MLYDTKCFSLKLCKKKEIKKAKNKQENRSRKIRQRKKMRQKENKAKKVSKKFVKVTMKKKRFIQSFKPRKETFKLKRKIKNIQ